MVPLMGLRFWKTREFGTALVLVAMLVVCEIAARANSGSSFVFSGQMLRLLHQDAAFVGIAAIGACIVILSGGVDLSAGSVMSLGAVTFAYLFQVLKIPGPVALLAGILSGGLVGLMNGFLVGKVQLPPFVATLGFLSIARGICYWVTGGPGIEVSWRQRPFFLFPLLADSTAWSMAGLGILTAVLMARFSWGRYVYAVGGNQEAARFSGLAVDWIKVGIYTVAGLFSGLAGSSMALHYGSAYVAIANGYELKIIAACAIGGVSFAGGEGSVIGALLGAIALSVLENLLIQLRVQPEYIEIAYGFAIILAVSIDLHGREWAKWLGRKKA
jgi:ribose transport system permease protein